MKAMTGHGCPDCEVAWAAGFFDGEGSTFTVKGGRGRHQSPCVSLSQTNRENLARFHAAVGIGGDAKRILGPYTNPRSRKPFYRLYYQGEAAERVIANLRPYLGSEKRRQASDVLWKWRARRKRIAARQYGTKSQHARGRPRDAQGRFI